MPKLNRAYPFLLVALLALLLLFFGNRIATFYTDWLWFGCIGQRIVFTRVYGTRLFLFAVFGAASFLLAYLNLMLADRFSPPASVRVPGRLILYPAANGQPVGKAMQFLSSFRRVLDLLLILGALAFAILAGSSAQAEWDSFLRFAHPSAFHQSDPQFHNDLSYYIFTLPFLRYVQGWSLTVLLLVGAGVALLYLYQQGINKASGQTVFLPHVRSHLSAIAALALLAKAWGYYLDRYDLMYGGGQFPGAGYTDIHIRLPMLHVSVAVTIVAALTVAVNIRQRTIILPVAALGLWLAFSLAGVVIPGAFQRFRVMPNEAALEAPFINRALDSTRAAYDLDRIRVLDFPADETLSARDIERNQATLSNVQLWDNDTLLETYQQQQGLRQYYVFSHADVDRYRLQGAYRQVMLATREMATDQLDMRAHTWPNLHLRYTHGFGAVVSPAGAVCPPGLPELTLKDIPPVTSARELELMQPRIYYGVAKDSEKYVVVGTKQREFDYPADHSSGAGDRENDYAGRGGVRLTPLTKLAFAARFGNGSLLLTQDITRWSRILFVRYVPERVKRVAPFLLMDNDPYPVIVNGQIVWVQDAYTTSEAYPCSAPSNGGDNLSPGVRFNYIRNSVKATVDAYNGSVTLYAADESDPLLRTYRRLFPGLIRPAADMPEALQEHRRYPEDLFAVQRRILAEYHVRDSRTFYSREDSWQVARIQANSEGGEGRIATTPLGIREMIAPYYALLRLPGESAEEFVLLSPFTPNARENMIALLAARCDGDRYGDLILYRFPISRNIYGPEQIGKRIRSDGTISPYLSLVDQRGSRVAFGPLQIIPIERSLLYIQPIYVRADFGGVDRRSSIPELKKVVVVFGDRIAMQPTLSQALATLFKPTNNDTTAGTERSPVSPRSTPPPLPEPLKALIDQAAAEYGRGQAALRDGDFAAYGEASRALGDTLRKMRSRAREAKGP